MATIAEVLHYAADYCLAEPDSYAWRGKEIYSCFAIKKAARKFGVKRRPIITGLRNMGLDTSCAMFFDVKDPQGARYAWLKFAALIAEEQGV